ncbi:efflux RND transporter periplasmic adaptor subunit [Pontibacter chitinilyticus]|uniref:efflux RND transporter periplasmic adaptor subunit n=1 Tax=Pontibacter chitinilyticus TaxID=2674989 RepID=UPI00321A8667
MKRYLNILLAFLLMLSVGCSEPKHEHSEKEVLAENTTYTCPMHPQVVENEPGTCPICGMQLVPVNATGEKIEITDDLAFLLQPTSSTVISSIATVQPERKTMQASVQMEGIVTYDPRQVYTVPARVPGRIEQLYVKYNFQPVRKGQKLLEIYSPELITAQQELLYLMQSAPEDKALIVSAKQKLRLLGATDAQINHLIRAGEASYTFALYSPYDGYVISLNTAAPGAAASASLGSGMNGNGTSMGNNADPSVPSEQSISLREGMYVAAGQTLFRIVNPNQLWAEFNVPAGEINALAKGAPVAITFPQVPQDTLQGKLDFLEPFYQDGENFAKVRVYLPGGQKQAMVGQLVSARGSYTTSPALWVPKAAVLDLGTTAVAFVKANGVFKPVSVTTGTTANGDIQVIEGLNQTDKIAANAQFLVDSQSFIKVKE